MKQSYKYYNLKNILKRNAQYNLIIGERSNGKTYAVEKLILENFFKKGEQGAIIRRWREDFRNKRGYAMFAPFVTDGTIKKLSHGAYNNIMFRLNTWWLVNSEDDNIEKVAFCYSFALSEVEHDKSTSYPNITTILFDEFLTRSYYINDEFVIFCNCVSTIIRDRDNVKIFMCGNTVNKYSPYFKEMGLTHIKEMKQGDIDVYTYGDSKLKIAVEYCNTSNKTNKKKSDVYFAFNNPHLEMVKSGKWEIANYPHLPNKYMPKDILFKFWLVFGDDILQGEIITLKNELFCYIHRKTTELKYKNTDIIYDLQSHSEYNVRYSFTKPIDNIDRKIYNLYKSNRFFYQSNDIGEIVNNFVKEG